MTRRAIIKRLFYEQRGECYLCDRQMTLALGHANTATVDHMIPVVKLRGKTRGMDADQVIMFMQSNIKGACTSCNHAKGSRALPMQKKHGD